MDNLVATVNDDLFVSVPTNNSGENAIEELDAETGASYTLPKQYPSPLLRTNPSGTHVYIREDDGGSGGDGSIDEYDVSGGAGPTLTNNYVGRSPENSQDFLVDESAGLVFTLEYPGPGFGVTDMNTDTMTTWYFGNPSYGGQALAALPSGPLYGASSTYIYEFNASGRIIARIRGS